MASEHGDASGVPKMISDMAHGDPTALAAVSLALQAPPEVIGLTGPRPGLHRVLLEARQPHDRGGDDGVGHGRAPDFPERVLRVLPKQGRLFTECPAGTCGSPPRR